MKTRPTQRNDSPALAQIAGATALFPPEMLPDLIEGFLTDDACKDVWLTCEDDGAVVGFLYAVPEPLAEGAWNMLALAMLSERQGQGGGTALTAALETLLRGRGQRILIADTSSTDAFAATRAFYAKAGYTEEARIRDFWTVGDDKVVFWKSLI